MSYFDAKMQQNRFQLELHPRPHWGSLQCSPRLPNWIKVGPTSKAGKQKGGGIKGEEKRGGEPGLPLL